MLSKGELPETLGAFPRNLLNTGTGADVLATFKISVSDSTLGSTPDSVRTKYSVTAALGDIDFDPSNDLDPNVPVPTGRGLADPDPRDIGIETGLVDFSDPCESVSNFATRSGTPYSA